MAKRTGVSEKKNASIVTLRQKILIAGTMVVMVNLVLLIVFGDDGLVEMSRLRAKEQLMAQRNESIAGENVEVYRSIDRLKSDPVYIESVARNELGMVAKDDIVILMLRKK